MRKAARARKVVLTRTRGIAHMALATTATASCTRANHAEEKGRRGRSEAHGLNEAQYGFVDEDSGHEPDEHDAHESSEHFSPVEAERVACVRLSIGEDQCHDAD